VKIILGKEKHNIEPMSLTQVFEFLTVAAPYLVLIEEKWPEILKRIKEKQRGRHLSMFFMDFREELDQFPQDITKLLAICLGKPVDWVAKNVLPHELVNALPKLDEMNNFDELFKELRRINKGILQG